MARPSPAQPPTPSSRGAPGKAPRGLAARCGALVLLLAFAPALARAQAPEAVLAGNATFAGAISDGPDVDLLSFEGSAGTQLTVSVKAGKKQPLKPVLEVLSTDGRTVLAEAASGKGAVTLTAVLLPSTGSYGLRVSGNGTTGTYTLRVKEKLGKAAGKPAAAGLLDGGGTLALTFAAQPGDVLSAVIRPGKASVALPGDLTLTGPNGALPIAGALSANGKGTVTKLKPTALPALGEYVLAVTNAGEPGELVISAKLKRPKPPKSLVLEQPDLGGESVVIPPDPIDVASDVDPSVPTGFFAAAAFLFEGDPPVQTGVQAGALQPLALAVLRGRVTDREGAPLVGAKVSVLDAPELGYTATRPDGHFDLAANGGRSLVVVISKPGYLPAQRRITPRWNQFEALPDVVLVPLDSASTVVSAGANAKFQAAAGSEVSDRSGARRARALLAAGTSAQLRLPDGSTQPLTSLTLRATEYTVGDNGPQAMPGGLPFNSAYTYCLEYSVDEALAAGAVTVEFSKPLVHLNENFLGFPVGMVVPAGWYDAQQGAWVASDNGLVVGIVGITGGMAELDLDGSGIPADSEALSALGVTTDERKHMAAVYTVGQELWRVPLPHFTPWDLNWPYGPPAGAELPDVPPPVVVAPTQRNPCPTTGSVLRPQVQVLGEALPLAGGERSLHYASDRVPGREAARTIKTTVTGDTVHPDLLRVEVEFIAAGQLVVQTFPPTPGQVVNLEWDGLNSWGQDVTGTRASVTIRNVFATEYYEPGDSVAQAFAQFPTGSTTGAKGIQEVGLSRRFDVKLVDWDARGLGLGGWSLTDHHVYDRSSATLFRGDGETVPESPAGQLIDVFAGSGVVVDRLTGNVVAGTIQSGPAAEASFASIFAIAMSPTGELYLADSALIHRVDLDGQVHHVAGNQNVGWTGDDGPALQATINVDDMAFGPDGSLYITQWGRGGVRRISPDGIITRVAGQGHLPPTPTNGLYSGDGGPALDAVFPTTRGIAVADDGTIYVGTGPSPFDGFGWRLRRIGTDGIIERIAGGNAYCTGLPSVACGDEGPAIHSRLGEIESISLAPDGSILLVDGQPHGAVRRITPDGLIDTVAGRSSPQSGNFAEGLPATDMGFGDVTTVLALPDGRFLVADACRGRVHIVNTQGEASRFVDGPPNTSSGEVCKNWYSPTDFYPSNANFALMGSISDLVLGPDGTLYVADAYHFRVYAVRTALPGVGLGETVIVDDDGLEAYVFTPSGRHTQTRHALTGALLRSFGYDEHGRLLSIRDEDGRFTTIERNLEGVATAIVTPGGISTQLTLDPDGWLSGLSHPGGVHWSMAYDPGGLLASVVDPTGAQHGFSYDAGGLLVLDQGPAGSSQALASTPTADGYQVNVTSAMGRTTTWLTERTPTGGQRRTVTGPDGGSQVMTIEDDGVITATSPDGTVVTSRTIADPLFKMQSPLVTETKRKAPSGLTLTATSSRVEEIGDPGDLFTLQSLTDVTTVNGKTWSERFDVLSRTLTRTTPALRTVVTQFDEQGRLLFETPGPGLETISVTRDNKQRITSAGAPSLQTQYAWDTSDRLASMTRAGAQTHFDYDAAGLLSTVTQPSGRAHGFGWDAAGRLVAVHVPSGATHDLTLDAAGRRTSWTPPGHLPWAWSHDLDGNWESTVLASGRVVDGQRDGQGRLTAVVTPEAVVDVQWLGGGAGGCCGSGAGRLASFVRTPLGGAAGATQSIAYAWDGELRTQATWSGAANGTIATTWGADWLPTAVVTDGQSVALTRDADGLLTGIGPLVLTRDGPAGLPTAASGAGGAWGWTFDGLGRVTGLSTSAGGSAQLDWTRSFDAAGRVTSLVETAQGVTRTWELQHDEDGQLATVSLDGVRVAAYAWDLDGNRTSGPGGAATFDAADRIQSANGQVYGVNVDGQVVQRGADTFVYGSRGELLSAVVDGQPVSYSYDGWGRLVARSDGDGTWQYLYDELHSPFAVSAARSPGGVLDLYYRDDSGRLLAFSRGGTAYVVATDPLGSPRVVATSDGTTIEVVEWDAFGVRTGDSAPGFWLPLGFAGGLEDPLTGLVRFGLRDYEPASARFTTLDPLLFESNEHNLYRYARNSPQDFTDPSGALCVAADAYAIYGAGAKLCIDGSGISLCVEVGLGAGGGLEIDPFGGISRDGSYIDAQLKVAAGPVSLGPKFRLTECEMSFKSFECKVAMFNLCERKAKARAEQWSNARNMNFRQGLRKFADALMGKRDPNTGDWKSGVRIQGKLAAGGCAAAHW